MKKLVLSAMVLLGISAASNAQVNASFAVDITAFLNGGGTINTVVSMAGNFADRGSTDLPNWTPSAGAMMDMGNNIWMKSISFDGTATDSLMWKYVKGSDWGDGDEGSAWDDTDPATAICAKKSDNHNRKWLLPTSGDFVIASEWAECHTILSGVKDKMTGLQVFMGPNPATSAVTIRFGGSANSVIKITALDGKVAKTITVSESGETEHRVDISDLHAGMYYVTVVDGNKGYKAPLVVVK